MHRYLSGLVLALSIGGCDNKAALTADEQRLLLSDQDFASFGVSRGGHYGKSVQYLTRTVELSYSHSADTGFYLYSGVTLHPNAGDALINNYAANVGASHSLENNGLQKRPLSLSPAYGDGSSLDLLLSDGEPVGNMFFTRIASRSVFVLFTGVYFEHAEDFEAFVEPRMRQVRQIKTRDPLLGWVGDLFASDSGKPAQPKNQ